ncbi:hypothetical protein [Paenimyroides ceti]
MLQVKKYTRNRPIINRTIPLPMQILELCMKINLETSFYASLWYGEEDMTTISIMDKQVFGSGIIEFVYHHSCRPDDNMFFNGGSNKRVHEVIEDLKYVLKHNEIKSKSNENAL